MGTPPLIATRAAAGSGCQGWPRATALARRAAAFTAWHRCCTLANQEGWGVGLRGDAPASRDLRTAQQAPRWPARNAPRRWAGGSPLGADGPDPARAKGAAKRLAPVGGRGQHHGLRGTRLTRMPVVTAPAVTTHTNGCWACGLLLHAVSNRPHAQGKWAQDITGVACSGSTSRALAAACGPATCDRPLC